MTTEFTEMTDYTAQDAALAQEIQNRPGVPQAADVPYGWTVERARETFETAKARLYRQDGQPIYGEAEHKQRMSALLADMDKTIEDAVALAERAAQDAEIAVRRGQRDPILSLDSLDSAKAAAQATFYKENIEWASADELVEQARTTQLTGTKLEKMLFLRYAGQRVATERAKSLPTAANPHGTQHPDADRLHALATILDALAADVAPRDLADKQKAATQERAAVNRLRIFASSVRRGADGSAAQAIAAQRRRMQGQI